MARSPSTSAFARSPDKSGPSGGTAQLRPIRRTPSTKNARSARYPCSSLPRRNQRLLVDGQQVVDRLAVAHARVLGIRLEVGYVPGLLAYPVEPPSDAGERFHVHT